MKAYINNHNPWFWNATTRKFTHKLGSSQNTTIRITRGPEPRTKRIIKQLPKGSARLLASFNLRVCFQLGVLYPNPNPLHLFWLRHKSLVNHWFHSVFSQCDVWLKSLGERLFNTIKSGARKCKRGGILTNPWPARPKPSPSTQKGHRSVLGETEI